jgi:hypothetical protein
MISLIVGVISFVYVFGMNRIAAQALIDKKRTYTAVTIRQVKHFFISKGYTVCNITPINNSRKWFAILMKNKEYIIATAFANEYEIEGFEESIM